MRTLLSGLYMVYRHFDLLRMQHELPTGIVVLDMNGPVVSATCA